MKFKYLKPDAVDLPGVGVDIEQGDVVEAAGDIAAAMECQPETWRRVDTPKSKTETPAESATIKEG